jgi:conjugative relaxase-like TrwC/TraI family protein
VTEEQFARLCDGLHPVTGERLVRHATPKTYLNFYGERVTSVARRAGYDATFSAPKSVSLAALVGGDARVAAAHREAVTIAFGVLEERAQARMGGNRPAQDTGRLVAARFEHALARPDRSMHYAAPQLHTHCLVFNVTETDTGETRPLQPLELHRSQRLATAVYRAALAERLVELGYEVARDPRTGAPEIKGFTKEYLQASSPRRAELLRRADEMAARLEGGGDGARVRRGAGLLHAAAHADRAGKRFDPDRARGQHLELDARFGHQARRVVEAALERGFNRLADEREAARRADAVVTEARYTALARGTQVDSRRLLADALGLGLCETTYTAVRSEFEARLAAGDLGDLLRERSPANRGHAAPAAEPGAKLEAAETADPASARQVDSGTVGLTRRADAPPAGK